MNSFTPMLDKNLLCEQKKSSLMAISVIKEKRDSTLKGHACADGCGQCDLHAKEEIASLTAYLDSFMMITCIEAEECRKIVVRDVNGAFLIPDMTYFTIVRFADD